MRIGGFGGPEGLAAYLREGGFSLLIDATHPFAARISHNAALACTQTGIPLLQIVRPEWQAGPGDSWIEVPDMAAACRAIGPSPRRVFLSIGRLEARVFCECPQHFYLLRSIEPPEGFDCLPHLAVALARPPFDLAGERALLAAHRIDALVTKNSGAAATGAKLEAARALGIGVIMVARPALAAAPRVANVGEALRWLAAHGMLPADPLPDRRGV